MSHLPEFREVRVTPRGARLTPNGKIQGVTAQFIAPELSAPSTHALEMEKGKSGWTDFDKKVATVTPVFPVFEDDVRCAKASDVVRRNRPKVVRVVSAGPSNSYRDAQIRAAKLAAENSRIAAAKRAKKGK